MERKINILSICFTLFLVLLFAAGMLSGVPYWCVYLLSFVLPIILALVLEDGEKIHKAKYLSLNSDELRFVLPIIVPTVVLVMFVSLITSILIGALTGAKNSVDIGDSFVFALITHALLPAILEEALFRYLPLRLLGGHSKITTVLLSSTLFALVHHNLFSIPYAFVAGVIFMVIDLACDSVIPSVLIHFINNAVSVGILFYDDNAAFLPAVAILLGILSIISIACIEKNKDEYKNRFSLTFERGEKFECPISVIALGAICLLIAIVGII